MKNKINIEKTHDLPGIEGIAVQGSFFINNIIYITLIIIIIMFIILYLLGALPLMISNLI